MTSALTPRINVEQSLTEVIWTLIQAVGLVVLVIFVFLQDWRTTIIPRRYHSHFPDWGHLYLLNYLAFPSTASPYLASPSATGMVVDDAIVVVENVAAKIQNEGANPRKAAIVAMEELTGAVIATSLVLMAVFVPVAFFPGTTGALYQQFALTIAFCDRTLHLQRPYPYPHPVWITPPPKSQHT